MRPVFVAVRCILEVRAFARPIGLTNPSKNYLLRGRDPACRVVTPQTEHLRGIHRIFIPMPMSQCLYLCLCLHLYCPILVSASLPILLCPSFLFASESHLPGQFRIQHAPLESVSADCAALFLAVSGRSPCSSEFESGIHATSKPAEH